MNPQSPSQPSSESSQSEPFSEHPPEFQQELERLEARLERLRGLAQTLVGGLAIALVISIGISGWFAYRSFLQEHLNHQQAEKTEKKYIEIQEKLENLEREVQSQQRKVERMNQELPQELETLTNSVKGNQRQLELLRERLSQIETQVDESTQSESGEKNENDSNN